jgi:hypothetical protein
MKIAYLVLAHKNPEQVKRLLKLLNGDVYIHLDKKCDLESFQINMPNINFINDRVSIGWGGYSMIKATFNLINTAKNNSDYDYYILLSGDDYPIQSLEELNKYLKENREYSFLEFDKFDDKWQHAKWRYQNYKLFETPNLLNRALQKALNMFINKRAMYRNMVTYKGSQWWCLNSESIEYLLKYIKDNRDILRYFKHTHIPDEMFFQIILLNSPLRNKIINDNLRYILLESSHPETLTKNNFTELINANNKFFARKFDSNIDTEILDLLDKRI